MLIVKNVKLKSKTNPPGHSAYIESVYDVQKTPEVLCKMRVSFLVKLQAQAWNLIKKETLEQVFDENFEKFLRTRLNRTPRTSSKSLMYVQFKRDVSIEAG